MFKVGDVVALRSGGPQMTVEGLPDQARAALIGDLAEVRCVWFDPDGEHGYYYAGPQRGEFPAAVLKSADGP